MKNSLKYVLGFLLGAALFIGAVPALATTAGAYTGKTYHQLVDIVQGSNTTTVVQQIDPAWSFGIPLAVPYARTVATTTGSMASSTKMFFQVAALDGNGTTTISNTIFGTTDASTTHQAAEGYTVTWSAVAGATGYAVYLDSTLPLTHYILATSTSGVPNTQLTVATTSGELSGSNSLLTTTAYAAEIANGASFLHGGNLSITGNLALTGSLTEGNNAQPNIISTTSPALGGGSLTGGTCVSATSTLPASVGTVSSTTAFVTTPQKYPGPDVEFWSYAWNTTQIVTEVCEPVTGTPISTPYNIRAL